MKFFDLNLSDPGLRGEIDQAYGRVMDSGWMILGPELAAFEAEFAAWCGAGHCVGVGNGLDALTLTLRAAGVQAGAEVIVPAHTFAATWMAVEALGATPVPVEVDPLTYTIGAAGCAAAVTGKTAAIVPVSLYGHPVDLEPLMALARRHGLFVLEDAAQSHGAASNGVRPGRSPTPRPSASIPPRTSGRWGCGRGHHQRRRDRRAPAPPAQLRLRPEVRATDPGVNSRLDELQAAFLRVFLPRLDTANDQRRALASAYDAALSGSGLTTPAEANWARHVYHLYVIRSPERDALQARLKTAGIETLIHYPIACHLQAAFAHRGFKRGDFPAEALADEVLSLPLWPAMPVDNVRQVALAVR
uniref:DegT/DnrJ/EryC1/StrS family aminotransferase n=1 Tax=Phenylobacterium glaciei TaxID=2803784 RepID=A0A974P5L2_9CAUL|nr:DegT/DnrJ/EryC1/StrS family aminotransferase [Phenylobacterium glaciei]